MSEGSSQAAPPAPPAGPAKSAGAAADAPEEVPPSKAYLAPQEIRQHSVPAGQPEAKVVLNLPEKPAGGSVGAEEVRAARARRRAATVKIERSAVDGSMKLSDLGVLGQAGPQAPMPTREAAPTAPASAPAEIDVDLDGLTPPSPVAAHAPEPPTPPRARPLAAPNVAEPLLGPDDKATSSGAKSLALAVAALIAVAAAGYFALRGNSPEASPPPLPTARIPAAPSTIVDVTPPPKPTPLSDAIETSAPSSAPSAVSATTTTPSTPPAKPVATPPRPPRSPAAVAAPPAPRPKPKGADIPSEI